MYNKINIYNFKKKKNRKKKKNKNTEKAKETKEEKKIPPENWLKNEFAVARVEIFLVTRISGNKSILFFGLAIFKKIEPT